MDAVYHIILYVADQKVSRDFYAKILKLEPRLDVEGMTEFLLSETLTLGLMPENGIAKIIGDHLPHPSNGNGIPRCELYIVRSDAEELYSRAIECGAIHISSMQDRDWGHTVGYLADPDAHVLAFAKPIE